MTTSESKGRLFLQNESIRIDSHNESNRIVSNRELECSTNQGRIQEFWKGGAIRGRSPEPSVESDGSEARLRPL